jgi:Electron transfer DM13
VSDTGVVDRVKPRTWLILAVPQAVLFGGVVVMLVVHPNAFRSALMSTRAILVNVGLLAGWLLLSLVAAPRVLRNVAARAAVLSVVAGAAVAVLVVPTLREHKVVEAFPTSKEATVAAPESASETPGDPIPPPTAEPQPVRVSTGELRGIDHDASGSASVFRRPDGSSVVALENIDIEPGPDYHVYVVRGADREQRDGATYLAGLRGNRGTQYYEVPREADPGEGWTVLVWCRAFGVPIANATQHAL